MKLTGYTYEENKILSIKFKYLYILDGSTLPKDNNQNCLLPDNYQSLKDLFDYNTLDIILYCNGEFLNTTPLIKINNFVDYLISQKNTGIYIQGNCGKIINDFISDYSYISTTTTGVTAKLFSDYIEKEIIISDETILKKISNKTFQINFSPNSPKYKAILLEEFDVTAKKYQRNEITNIYSSNIGFELEKKNDNKKSWVCDKTTYNIFDIINIDFINGNNLILQFVDNNYLTLFTPFSYNKSVVIDYGLIKDERLFFITTSGSTNNTTINYDLSDYFYNEMDKIEHIYSLKKEDESIDLRETNYNIKSEKLILNSKEVTLGVNICKFLNKVILNSIFKDNLLNNSYSLLFDSKLFETFEIFENFILNNFGNSLTYKTIDINEWLIKLFDIYNQRILINPIDSDGKNIYDAKYNIQYIIGLINQIDDKWFQMIENVVPSTMIWEYVKLLQDSFIQRNKFTYKKSNIFIENTTITGIPYIQDEIIGSDEIEQVVVDDTTSNYLIVSNTYYNNKIVTTISNYNQMFCGYYNII